MGEADFSQFMHLKNQLVIAAENFVREENLLQVVIPTMSKDMDEQVKLPNKVDDKVDRVNRKICVTLLWYVVGKPESSNAQGQLFAREKEHENFQETVYLNSKLA